MSHYRVAFGFLLIAASLLSVSQASAALPERLRQHNFNFYSAACPANDMVLQNVNGGMVTLSSLRGKVVILNFWKIDCPPCSVEKPILERIRQKYAGRGLEIVAVNLFDTGDRLKSYCQCHNFRFTFAFDPENRFSVRRQTLPSGMPTAFVINSNSEAIYEVPGVPTTYLFDRNGRVVGNSVGMVNWEEPPFSELLESLLGPAPRMVAQNSRDFSKTAGQGGNPSPASQISRRAARPSLPASQEYPLPTPQAPRPAQAYPSLAFQQEAPPAGSGQPSSGFRTAPVAPSLAPSQPPTKPQTAKPAPPTGAAKKPQVAKPARTIAPRPSQGSASAVPGVVVNPALRTQPGVTVPGSTRGAVPPATRRASPAPTAPAPSGAASLPALPPALPYHPGGARASQPNIVPDEQGNVMARIPGYGKGGSDANALPPAQAITPGNPIDGFILDSFGRVRPEARQQPQRVQPPSAQTPPSSVFGQLNEDIQALGTGIKDTFSRFLPQR